MTAIVRRDLDFDFDPAIVRRDWCNGDPFVTTLMSSLSLLFPEGERFFVESVKQLQHHVESPALRADIAGFIGQEAMHGREHRALNALLVAHGYRVAPRVEAHLRAFLKLVRRVLTRRSQLAITCALEHFTALLGELVLTDTAMHAEVDEVMRPVWLWHALEETEHKAVAFDVYRAAGGGYVRRAAMMVISTAVFAIAHGLVHARLMATRGILWRPWTWLAGLRRMWWSPGYLPRLIPGYLAYFRSGFHPSDRDARALIERHREHWGA